MFDLATIRTAGKFVCDNLSHKLKSIPATFDDGSTAQRAYWRDGQPWARAMAVWEDTLRYLYLPRLKDREVLGKAILSGATGQDFFGTAYGQHDEKYEGFQLGSDNVQFDNTLLLIEPNAAEAIRSEPEEADGRIIRSGSKPEWQQSPPPQGGCVGRCFRSDGWRCRGVGATEIFSWNS
jgi:hypothetical protein